VAAFATARAAGHDEKYGPRSTNCAKQKGKNRHAKHTLQILILAPWGSTTTFERRRVVLNAHEHTRRVLNVPLTDLSGHCQLFTLCAVFEVEAILLKLFFAAFAEQLLIWLK
jgi:hypothetical protein